MVFRGTMFLLLLKHLILTSEAFFGNHHHHSLLTDKAALLAFRRTIVCDPNSVVANWKEATDVCNFTGVRCGKINHRVVTLNLNDSSLVGLLSPSISNLTALRYLQLVNNHFYGIIPPELGYLRHLRYLQLDLNHIHGSIPNTLALLYNLTVITLRENNLSGSLPPSLFYNCTLLENVDLSDNNISGKIPPEIGNCPQLWTLNLYNNQFTGGLPFSMINTYMTYLDVENNHLSGELPLDIVGKLPHLQGLRLSDNDMVSLDGNTNLDPFFIALANCTILEELELAGMGLGGRLPNSIGKLRRLTNLHLEENNIFGSIPPHLANLSHLNLLNLTSNLLNETISTKISGLLYLQQLSLSHNNFTGEIPAEFGDFSRLGLLDLSHNRFTGEIPKSLGKLVHINYMFLNNNMLSGSIPPSLGQCTEVLKLDLSHNRLTGRIPVEILGIHNIGIFLNLSHNLLEGVLPIELSKLEKVQEIDLSSNNLTGNIFFQISDCIAVKMINFSHNSLQGSLPDSLGQLKNLESLDVSSNQLSGKIPITLNKTPTLNFLNLSFNDFNGVVPHGGVFNLITNLSFLGDQHICGSVRGLPVCSPRQNWFHSSVMLVIFCIIISLSALLSTAGCVLGCRYIRRIRDSSVSNETEREPPTTPEIIHNFPRITYKELSEATAGFDDHRQIGTGSYGRVYKGVLSDGTAIAVKVLHLQTGNSTKSFNRECQVLKRIRHRNLIRIITACSLPDFKALVLPYMANGSLESRLYPHSNKGLNSGSSDLSLLQRVSICSDIAEGMAYLHHHSPVKVIHCDLKPSNVLLNDDMTALVSDFGISRLVMTIGGANPAENLGNSTANMLHGSIGYIAPEYAYGSNTSTKGDVYSFGVLVLEMVTRKRPTDDMFVGGLNLHKFVKSYYHGKVERIIDSSLVRATRDQSPEVKRMWEVAIGELIELGILCTQESPSTRPTMLDAADDLDRLKRYLTGDTTATFASSLGISSSTMGDD